MAKKTYTAADRERIYEELLDAGQRLFSEKGFRSTTLIDIYESVGISKSFFYSFFPSKEALAVRVLTRQRQRLLKIAQEIVQKNDSSWRDNISSFFDICLYGKNHGVFIMNLEDTPALFNSLPPQELTAFQSTQESFYQALLTIWGIQMDQEELHIFANKVLALLLLKNSNLFDVAAFFPHLAEKAIGQWIEDIIDRLSYYRIHQK